MCFTAVEIVDHITSYAKKCGGDPFTWFVGISSKPDDKLFRGHLVPKKGSFHVWIEALSSAVAHRARAQLMVAGYDGGLCGSGDDPFCVYAYRKGGGTREAWDGYSQGVNPVGRSFPFREKNCQMKLPKKLYKYQKLELQAIKNLMASELYFSIPEKFNDPFDCGTIPKITPLREDELHFARAYAQRLVDLPPVPPEGISLSQEDVDSLTDLELQKALTTGYKPSGADTMSEVRETIGVASLSAIPNNPLMWAHYADRHCGVCLEFDTAFTPFNRASKVHYHSKVLTLSQREFMLTKDAAVRAIILSKHKHWEYEQEWRVIEGEGDQALRYSIEALTGIYFGLRTPEPEKGLIRLIASDLELNVKIFECRRLIDSFELDFRELN
jgi:Protein of unknown function (DUF2971)